MNFFPIIVFLPCLFCEIVRVPLHPVRRSSSWWRISRNYFQPSFRVMTNGPTTRYKTTSEQLINYRNLQYYGEVSVGTPPQRLRVLFDTGSTDTWFASRRCWFFDIFCWLFSFYDRTKSSTYRPDGSTFEVRYLDSNYSGIWSVDTVRINSLIIQNQAFAEMTNIFNADYFTDKYDGIIGMSCRRISTYGNIPMFPNILANGVNMEPVFSFYLNRKDGASVGGEMVLGGVNPKYFKGDFEYMPTVMKTAWNIRMLSLKMNGIEFCNVCNAVIDTGTSLILGPKDQVDKINSLLGVSQDFQGRNVIDCSRIDMLPTIEFIFHRRNYTLKPQHYVVKETMFFITICSSPFDFVSTLPPNQWILGDAFMGRFYTVFDFGQCRIGFTYATGE
ncbi:Lysosomal aspartic protease [Schistosoma japonicum]|nr:Lysosomal aspartic protease [Schistosoma japonicum]